MTKSKDDEKPERNILPDADKEIEALEQVIAKNNPAWSRSDCYGFARAMVLLSRQDT